MKIIFLNPPAENALVEYPDERGDSYIETEDFGSFPPLGVLYVLSYLQREEPHHELFFKDCVAERMSFEALGRYISAIGPDIVGITSFTISLIDVIKAACIVRKHAPGAHICLGGHHPIAFPFEAAGLEAFDSIIVGEGEEAFTGLVRAIENDGNITKVDGVYTRDSIRAWMDSGYSDKRFLTTVTVPPAYIDDLDSLPFPDRRFIRHIDYHSIVGVTDKLATIISSRGCPYKCVYCDVPYKRYRQRSIPNVVDEIAECLDMGYREFHFYDDLFNITPEKVIAFCDEVDRRGMSFIWDFRGRVNTVTRESLVRAKRAGCRMISFGVETGTNEGLELLRKGTTVEKTREVFGWCRELGIATIADYIIGLPFEKSRADVKRSIDFLIDLDPDYAQVSILSLYPNTQLFNEAVAKGFIPPEKWREFARNPSRDILIDHWEEFLSIRELVALQKYAYRRYYLRPSYIIRSIMSTRTLYEFKTKLRGLKTLLMG